MKTGWIYPFVSGSRATITTFVVVIAISLPLLSVNGFESVSTPVTGLVMDIIGFLLIASPLLKWTFMHDGQMKNSPMRTWRKTEIQNVTDESITYVRLIVARAGVGLITAGFVIQIFGVIW